MENMKAAFLIGAAAWLLLIIVPFTPAQQPLAVSTRPATFNWPSAIVVVGAVRDPARFDLRRTVRLTELLACGGGLLPDAKNEINIYRKGPNEEIRAFRINLKAIKNHRAEDLTIQPYDIVQVLSKKAIRGGDCFSLAGCFMNWLDKLNELPLRLVR